MLTITEATCTRVSGTYTTFRFFDRDFETVRHIGLLPSKCTSDPSPVRGDRVLLVSERGGIGNWECADILEHRSPDEGVIVETVDDLWSLHDNWYWICVTTNGEVKANGQAVMGKGCAKEAVDKFPNLASELGHLLQSGPNSPHIFEDYRLITFPTKRQWRHKSIPALILQSYRAIISDEFKAIWSTHSKGGLLCMPRPGCGNGGLEWDDVRRQLLPHWDVDTIVVSK